MQFRAGEASPVEVQLQGIRASIEQGEYLAALGSAHQLLQAYPHNRDLLYSLAVTQRALQRIPEALDTLERLQQQHPRYSRLFQELGYCRAAMRDTPGAIQSFLLAVNLNPALPGSWNMLVRLFMTTGDTAKMQTAAAHVAALARLPTEIITANSMFADDDLAPAEQLVRAYMASNEGHVEAMRLLARIGLKRDRLDEAEPLLEAVLRAAPEYAAARFEYATVLLRRHNPQAALRELEKLCASEPDNGVYRTSFAAALVGLGRQQLALEIYRGLLASPAGRSEVLLAIGHCLKTLGETRRAVRIYKRAARLRMDHGDAFWSLANLKTYRFSDEEMLRMQAGYSAPGTAVFDRYHLAFALGKAWEDRGDYAASFAHYREGNLLKRKGCRYRAEDTDVETALQIRHVSEAQFRRQTGHPDPSPIFIVGLPRSGSTLIEQILASHSQVEGTLELTEIPRLVLKLQGSTPGDSESRYPSLLSNLGDQRLSALGRQYIDDTQIYRSGKRRFIDKMPNNFRHIGLIHSILPNAKIIDARRAPMACGFSNYKQLFAYGHEFSYSLQEIGHYYSSYVTLMQHWDKVLPGRVLKVQHEDLLKDFEGQVRRMLAFLELDFEQGCLDFHRTARSVRTASSEQVRGPLSSQSVDQWRNFEPWLSPLRVALAQNL